MITFGRARTALVAAGAVLLALGSAMPAAAAPTGPVDQPDTTFTLAVIPDTQNEVTFRLEQAWFQRRAEWLVAQRGPLDIRFTTHTGDLVNWDRIDGPNTITYDQYERADAGLKLLDQAKMPYSLSIGNHDAAATCEGGSACPGDTRAALRNTESFNRFFPPSRFGSALAGLYEAGKIDNSFHTFTAGGVNWLVLNLELWPRTGVIEWAETVLGSHPNHTVIVNTHSHLRGDSTIEPSESYGHNSPQRLFDELYTVYPNVRFVLSGHTGQHGYRVDRGRSGHPIHQILSTYHPVTSTRLITIDTAANTFDTRVFNHESGRDHTDGSSFSASGLDWVRPAADGPSVGQPVMINNVATLG